MPIVKTPTYPDKHTGKEMEIGTKAAGSIQKVRTYQMSTVTIDGDMNNRRRVQLQYPYHHPVDPRAAAQLNRRQIFADGMAAWSALSAAEKAAWIQKALQEYRTRSRRPGSFKPHTGRDLFMSDYLRSH